MDDLLKEFLAETTESLAVLDVELVRFERETSDTTILSNIFRLMHTIKGTCGFLGLPRLGAVAHAGENILGKFRDGELEVTPRAVTLILKAIDQIRALLTEMEATGAEPAGSDADLIEEINALASGDDAAGAGRDAGRSAAAPTSAKAASLSPRNCWSKLPMPWSEHDAQLAPDAARSARIEPPKPAPEARLRRRAARK